MEFETLSYIDILKNDYSARSSLNHSYSLRAYARDLGISSSMLSELFNYRRKLSTKKAEQILKRINLSEREANVFMALVKKESDRSTKINKEGQEALEKITKFEAKKSLSLESFKLMSEWYYYAILTVMELDQYDGTALFIAKKLRLQPQTVQQAIDVLVKLELAEERNGQLFCVEEDVSTTHDIASFALKKFHKQYLMKAAESIDKVSIDKRDVTTMTMSVDSKKIPQAKKMIAQFRRDICKYLENGEKNSVYNVNIQLFPLTGDDI